MGRIFERFHRVDRSREGGTGLELSIARHIAEAQGGGVEVQSELEKASSFTLILPEAADSAGLETVLDFQSTRR